MSRFTMLSDPSHGWLLVPENVFQTTGLTADYVTSCSFVSKDRVIGLEEDCDAPMFLNLWRHRYGEIAIREAHVETSDIPSWQVFGTRPDDGPPLDHVARLATDIAADKMQISSPDVTSLIELSAWSSAEGMIRREFGRPYKGYYPSCGMSLRSEAVIAEVFDAIAILLCDPRRARRWTAA